jgi:hypothetical protein
MRFMEIAIMVCSASPSLFNVSNNIFEVERETASSQFVSDDSLIGFITQIPAGRVGAHSRSRNGQNVLDPNPMNVHKRIAAPLTNVELVALIDEALSIAYNFDDSRDGLAKKL